MISLLLTSHYYIVRKLGRKNKLRETFTDAKCQAKEDFYVELSFYWDYNRCMAYAFWGNEMSIQKKACKCSREV